MMSYQAILSKEFQSFISSALLLYHFSCSNDKCVFLNGLKRCGKTGCRERNRRPGVFPIVPTRQTTIDPWDKMLFTLTRELCFCPLGIGNTKKETDLLRARC